MSDSTDNDMTLFPSSTETKKYAIGVILSAVYAVAAFLPMSTFLGGGPTAFLTFAICIAPLFGVLLGPYKGAAFGMIGGVLATLFSTMLNNPLYLVIPTIIFGPAISGLFTGLCTRPMIEFKSIRVPGPILTTLYLTVIIILYLIPNYLAWWFMTYYILAVIVSIILQVRPIDLSFTDSLKYIGLLPLAFIGTMLDFSMMTMGAVYIWNIPAEVFGTVIFPFMLIERTAATLVSAVLMAVVIKTFGNELELIEV